MTWKIREKILIMIPSVDKEIVCKCLRLCTFCLFITSLALYIDWSINYSLAPKFLTTLKSLFQIHKQSKMKNMMIDDSSWWKNERRRGLWFPPI
jgi:hypothetical protein